MAQLILSDLDPNILEKLKVRAANHQRSLQEAIDAEQIAKMNAFREQAAQMRQALSGRAHADSKKLVHEDIT
jgi:plasmid stability protein